MRVGAIDVGTNSIHLLIADVHPDGGWTVVEKARRQVELGADGMGENRLDDAAFARGLEAMEFFAEAARSHDVEEIHCAATSAVREAKNGAEWCRVVRERTGIRVRVITGQEEGRLIFLGARSDLDFSRGKVLLMDLGGGSTEFILADSERPHVIESVPLGHIRLADRYHREDPMSGDAYEQLCLRVRAELGPLAKRVKGSDFRTLVGTAGTIRCLARVATLARGDQLPPHESGLLLRDTELDRIIKEFRTSTLEQIKNTPGVDPKRQRTLTVGATLVREAMRVLPKRVLVTSERSLRDGLIVDWVVRNRPELELLENLPNPRDRSIRHLLDRYGDRPEHGVYVQKHALALFDALAPIHRLGYPEREMLGYASLVHDIGHHISGASHNIHGEYLIRHTKMHGFTAPEIDFLAALVRYHRGTKPKTSHPTFDALNERDQASVPILAGMLKLADAMDRSHEQVVEHMHIESGDGIVRITARGRAPMHMERWSVEDRKDLLETALHQQLRVEFLPSESLPTETPRMG